MSVVDELIQQYFFSHTRVSEYFATLNAQDIRQRLEQDYTSRRMPEPADPAHSTTHQQAADAAAAFGRLSQATQRVTLGLLPESETALKVRALAEEHRRAELERQDQAARQPITRAPHLELDRTE